MMRAIAFTSVPSENSIDTLEDILVPKPIPSRRDLLVKIKGAATNPADEKVTRWAGSPGQKLEKPLIAGFDAAGVVEEIGEEVTLFKVGDEVYFSGAVERAGSFAEFAVVDERIVGRKPKGTSWSQAASIPLCLLTAWESLAYQLDVPENAGEDQKNGTILIIAGAGGVGSIAIQLAKRVFGLEVIATASRKETSDYCRSLGADFVVNHRKDLKEELKAIGKDSSVSLILDCYGLSESTWALYTDILTPFGKLCSLFPAAKVDLFLTLRKSLKYSSTSMFTRPSTGMDMQAHHEILNRAAELLEKGIISTTLEKEFPFTVEGLREALQTHLDQSAIGKNGIVFQDK